MEGVLPSEPDQVARSSLSHRLPKEIVLLILEFAFAIGGDRKPARCLYQMMAPNWCKHLADHAYFCHHLQFKAQLCDERFLKVSQEVTYEYMRYLARTEATVLKGSTAYLPFMSDRDPLTMGGYNGDRPLRYCLRTGSSRMSLLAWVDQPDRMPPQSLLQVFRRHLRTLVLSMPREDVDGSELHEHLRRIITGSQFPMAYDPETLRRIAGPSITGIQPLVARLRGLDFPFPPASQWHVEQLASTEMTLREELVWPLKVDWAKLPQLKTLCMDLHAFSSGEVPKEVVVDGALRMDGMKLSKLIICGLMSYKKYIPRDHHQWSDDEDESDEDSDEDDDDDDGDDDDVDDDGDVDAGWGDEDGLGAEHSALPRHRGPVPFARERVFGSDEDDLPMSHMKKFWHRLFSCAVAPGGSLEFVDFPEGVLPGEVLFSL